MDSSKLHLDTVAQADLPDLHAVQEAAGEAPAGRPEIRGRPLSLLSSTGHMCDFMLCLRSVEQLEKITSSTQLGPEKDARLGSSDQTQSPSESIPDSA